jgi:hypothetical protein
MFLYVGFRATAMSALGQLRRFPPEKNGHSLRL